MTDLTLSFLIYFWPVAGSEGKKKTVKFVFSPFFMTPTPKHCLTGNSSYKILVGGLCTTLIKYMTILYHYFHLPHLLLLQRLCAAELS
jgi:hypothetical protein